MSKQRLVIMAVLSGRSQPEVTRRYGVSHWQIVSHVRRTHARTHVKLPIQDLDVHVSTAVIGDIMRELTQDVTKRY